MNAPSTKGQFQWSDPLLLDDQLSDEERMIRDSARAYCQDKLMPRVLEANRHERFDREILNEMGALGFLGPTIMGKVETLTGSYAGGLYYLCGSMLVAATIVFKLGLGAKKVV